MAYNFSKRTNLDISVFQEILCSAYLIDKFKFLLFLQNRNGDGFAGPAFTKHLQRRFMTLIGKAVSVQMPRSAVVTLAYSDR